MKDKYLIIGSILAIALFGFVAVKAYSGIANTVIENAEVVNVGNCGYETGDAFGGYTAGYYDSADGYKVDGTTIIDGSGNVTVTGTTVVDRFTYGQTTLATSTAGSATTLLTSDIIAYSGLDMTPGDNAITITTQATSTMTSLIPNVGDCINFRIRNLDATSATSTTIAAGTGVDLVEFIGGDVVIEGGNEARLEFCRELDTDVTLYVVEYRAAD